MGDQKINKLRVFLSWSGERSLAVAEAFHGWLPSVLQMVKPYFTPSDIEKGARWSSEIREQLAITDFGVIFLTPENLSAPWILFESGALSKLDKGRVAPLLLGMDPPEVSGPLSHFQLTRFDKDDCFKLLGSLNAALGDMGLETSVLATVFHRAWPEFEKNVERAMAAVPSEPVNRRSDRDMLEEVLERVRTLEAGRDRSASGEGLWLRYSAKVAVPARTPLSELPLSQRAVTCLAAEGITTLGDLTRFSEKELLFVPNLGRKTLNEVVATLKSMEYPLASD